MKKILTSSKSGIESYEIQNEIGRGASGICYRCRNKQNGEVFAIKKILLNSLKKITLKEAMKEVNILKSLNHPNIIKYHESFTDESNLYIVMQYAQKGDLHNIIKRRRIKQQYFSEEQIWEMAKQLIEALQYLHSQNIMHRDFKTLNIFVNTNGNLKVGDLGVSKIVKTDYGSYSRVGTPLYLAPQIIKYEKYDFKADVWGLGCVLYLLSSLTHPFEGKNIISLGQNIVYSQPKLIKNVSQPLNNFILKMLQKSPAKRLLPKQLLSLYEEIFSKKGAQREKQKSKAPIKRETVTKYQSEKNMNKNEPSPQKMFFQNYNRVRNNFVEEKKTNLTKNEEFFIKNKGNIDITTKKIMDSTMIRKPTQDRGYLVYIPQNEQTPGKVKEKNQVQASISLQEQNRIDLNIVNLDESFKYPKHKSPSKRIGQKVNTQIHQQKSALVEETANNGGKRRNIQSAKPKVFEKDLSGKLDEAKRFTVSGNIHKLIADSSQLMTNKVKNMERPKSSIARGKSFGQRHLKYIKKNPNQNVIQIDRFETRTQILKKPEVLLL